MARRQREIKSTTNRTEVLADTHIRNGDLSGTFARNTKHKRKSRNATQPEAGNRKRFFEADDNLDQLLHKLQIATWDILIIGDGSGSVKDQPCGWSAVLIDRLTKLRRVSYGAVSQGTINMAEALPYMILMDWFDQHFGKQRLATTNKFLNVHIVTDSQVVANWGNVAASPDGRVPRKYGQLWSFVRHLTSQGYVIQYHWLGRLQTPFNVAADQVAGLARLAMKATPLRDDGNPASTAQRAADAIHGIHKTALQYESPPPTTQNNKKNSKHKRRAQREAEEEKRRTRSAAIWGTLMLSHQYDQSIPTET